MNLINAPWIPIRRRDGGREHIAPWQITDQQQGNPIMTLDTPRPDFNGALMQFLIGLLQVATPPQAPDDSDWEEWLVEPPSPETLRQCFAPLADAFQLDGDGPRFMQDLDAEVVSGSEPIDALLIDAPGGNTLKNNADHFIKRGGVAGLCPSCAAAALFTMQTNAPSGGAGHRTSLRGGGPLSTLVALDPVGDDLEECLWRNLWLNVLNKQSYSLLTGNLALKEKKDIFPWLAPTRISSKDSVDTYPEDVHPLQMYWAMPRRIRLGWDTTESGECNLCGEVNQVLLKHYATKNYGVNYSGTWEHPLSPHRINQKTGELIPLHPQLGGFSYRHWLAWSNGNDQIRAALVVREFTGLLRRAEGSQLRMSTFGYDMDNMKARCWYESTVPLYTIDSLYREQFAQRVEALIKSAEEVAGFVKSCIKEAWFKRPGDAKGDTSFLSQAFFAHTERDFYAEVRALNDALQASGEGIDQLVRWHGVLRSAAIELFDHWATQESLEYANPRRIAAAHDKLIKLIHSKKIQKILPFKNTERSS